MNTIHALDETLLDFTTIRKRMLAIFLKDRRIDPDERDLLDAFDKERDDLAAYRKRQIAAQSYERNGETRRTRDAFHEAGLEIVRLDDRRDQKHAHTKIVQLYPDTQNAG